ncbi:MAG: lytic transglycosylase domain-containing protein [Acidobacteriota bacterium]
MAFVAALAVAASSTVRSALLRAEGRAAHRYAQALRLRSERQTQTLRRLAGEREEWARKGDAWRLASTIGVRAARYGTHLGESDRLRIAEAIQSSARRFSVDPALIVALIAVESRFDPDAVSPRGAVGLMQLMPGTGRALAQELGIELETPAALADPRVNVELGTYYLATLIRDRKTLPEALAAYNGGPDALASFSDYPRAVGVQSRLDL